MPKIAVHIHLYYVEQLGDILRQMRNLDAYSYDLYVTMIARNEEIMREILTFKNDAKIRIVPNLGYDVGPFVDFLHRINLDDYDYILKIHTKRTNSNDICYFNGRRFGMNIWRKMLLDAVISKSALKKVFNLFSQDKKIGMIGSSYLLTDEKASFQNIENKIAAELPKIGMKIPQDMHFIAGTMFWVRTALLKPFLFYNIEDFAASDENIHDNTLAHVLERMFGLVISAQGYKIRGIYHHSYLLDRLMVSIKRFIFQKKVTHHKNLIIKICKIPVYCRKEKYQ